MLSMKNQLKNKIHKLEKTIKSDKKGEHKEFNPHVWRFGDKASQHKELKSLPLNNSDSKNE